MDRKYFIDILSIIIILTTIAGAIPANPVPFRLTQPDGTTLQAKQIGDEKQSHFETLDGYTIVQDLDGYWVYAVTNETFLLPTQNKVGKTNIKNLNLKKHQAPLRVVNNRIDNHTVNRISGSTSYSPTTIGTTKTVVILIGFTDKQPLSNHISSYYDNLLFSTSPGAKSLSNYYKEVSYNQLMIVGATSPKWYTSSHPLSYYGADSSIDIDDVNGVISKLAEEAISLANNDIDFSQYDGDGDGIVDHVIIIHAGNDQASSGISTDIWSHQCSLSVPVDGVMIEGYTMLAEGSPLGTFAHEFGHDIGLPDLYNTDTGAQVVEYWDIMDGGSWNNNGNTPAHPSAWSKIQLGWINPVTITAQTTVNIPQLETNQNNSVYKVSSSNMPSTEYFLVENRQKTGYDSYLPDDGIVIWHIDDAKGSILYNDVNNGIIKRVAVEDASNGLTVYLQGAAYSSEDQQTIFSPISSPGSNSNSGLSTGISINNIGSSASSMSVSIPASIPPPIQNVSLNFSGNYYTGNAFGVAVSGRYAFVADLYNGLVILDVSNPAAPKLVGSYNTAGYAWGVAVSGNYAYIADGVSGLVIVDVTNPAAPKLTGSYNTAGDASGVAVSGSYAYVADYNNGLVIIDVSNPAAPKLAGSYNTAGYALGAAVSGSYVYVADYNNGLVIIDVSNPAAPKLAGSYNMAGYALGVAVSGSYAYVADYNNGLVILDVSNPAAPKLAGNYNTAGGAWGVAVSGNYAYVADYNNGLGIIDVTNPAVPKLAGSYNTEGRSLGVAVADSYAYVADGVSGLLIFRIVTEIPLPILNISTTTTSVTVGSETSVTFAATRNGSAVSGATVTLSGNATGSGTTDANGSVIISVNATGEGAIIATAGKTGHTSATITITAISAPVLTTMTVSPATALLFVGNIGTFTEAPKDQFGNVFPAAAMWSSSNTSVGTINASTGVLTAIAVGRSTITATSGTVGGTATVTVISQNAASTGTVTRSFSSANVSPGATITVTLTPAQVNLFSNPGYQVIETVPAGFTYLETTAVGSIQGNVITLIQLGSSPITYTLSAPFFTGSYAISGTFKDQLSNSGIVSGTANLRVGPGYDANGDGRIDRDEAIQAVMDYFNGTVTKEDAINVVLAYFGG